MSGDLHGEAGVDGEGQAAVALAGRVEQALAIAAAGPTTPISARPFIPMDGSQCHPRHEGDLDQWDVGLRGDQRLG